jgi:hypothetical protein
MVNDRYDTLFSHSTGSAYDLKGRVLVPSVARRAVVQADLAAGGGTVSGARIRPAPVRWMGDRLMWLGEWLGGGMTPVSLAD